MICPWESARTSAWQRFKRERSYLVPFWFSQASEVLRAKEPGELIAHPGGVVLRSGGDGEVLLGKGH